MFDATGTKTYILIFDMTGDEVYNANTEISNGSFNTTIQLINEIAWNVF